MGKCIICWFGKVEYFLFNIFLYIDFGIFGSLKNVYSG